MLLSQCSLDCPGNCRMTACHPCQGQVCERMAVCLGAQPHQLQIKRSLGPGSLCSEGVGFFGNPDFPTTAAQPETTRAAEAGGWYVFPPETDGASGQSFSLLQFSIKSGYNSNEIKKLKKEARKEQPNKRKCVSKEWGLGGSRKESHLLHLTTNYPTTKSKEKLPSGPRALTPRTDQNPQHTPDLLSLRFPQRCPAFS